VCRKHQLWYDTKPKVEAREHWEYMKRDHRRTGTGNATQFLVHLLASLGSAPLPAGTGKNTQDQPDLHPKPDRSTCSTASAHASDAQYLAPIHTYVAYAMDWGQRLLDIIAKQAPLSLTSLRWVGWSGRDITHTALWCTLRDDSHEAITTS
jgi:hypothetical protein